MDINANVAQCLNSAMHLGFTRVHNICSGTTYDVPWGTVDWIAFMGAIAFFGCLFTVFAALAYMIIRD